MKTLAHHFLIAMPLLNDPNFRKSIIYIYQHNEDGAMGLIINKPMRVTVGDVLRHLTIPIQTSKVDEIPVLLGGPIAQEQGFIITSKNDIKNSDQVIIENDNLIITTSKIVLQAMAIGEGPEDVLITLGYSGWSAGQLENEILTNAWLVAPYNEDIFFRSPYDQRWKLGAASIGVDLTKLIPDTGHA